MKAYFPKLDSIRFYAFMVVFISHIYFFCYKPLGDGRLSSRIFGHGEIGVHIFFTLSGFLIMFLAIREYVQKNSFSILGFFKRRILRIWPVYMLVLGLSFIFLKPVYIDSCVYRFWYFLGNTCMIQGVEEDTFGATIGPLWSVSVEEQFYIVFPFIFLLGALAIRKRGKKVAWFAAFAVLVALFWSFISRYINSENWKYISYSTVSVMPSLLFGMLLAVFVSVSKFATHLKEWMSTHYKKMAAIAAALFVASIFTKFSGAVGVSLYIVVLGLCTSILIVLSISDRAQNETHAGKLQKTSRYLGRISYGLYAYHMFSILLIKHLFIYMNWGEGTAQVAIAQGLIMLALTILMAHLSYRLIERQFLKWK